MKYPFINQKENYDCGYACIKMIAKYYNVQIDENIFESKNISQISMFRLTKTLENIGINNKALEVPIDEMAKLCHEAPSILHWNKNHFIIIYSSLVKNGVTCFLIADPKFRGLVIYDKYQLSQGLIQNNASKEYKGCIISMNKNEQTLNS